MPWDVIEKCQGFRVCRAPPTDGQPDVFVADFDSEKLANGPFRSTPERAKQDGLYVMMVLRKAKEIEDAQAAGQLVGPRSTVEMPAPPEVPNRAGQEVLEATQTQVPVTEPQQADQCVKAHETAAMCSSTPLARPGALVHLSEVYEPALTEADIKLGRKLGAGGFGSVYVGFTVPQQHAEVSGGCNAVDGGMEVVVKAFEISRAGVSDKLLQQLASREMRALRKLQGQPHVVKVLAYGQLVEESTEAATGDDSAAPCPAKRRVQCLVLETCSNSLANYLEYAPHICEAESRVVVRQLAQQLTVFHTGQLGSVMVHGDIKPENTLLRLDRGIAICDFGACGTGKLVEGSSSQILCTVDAERLFNTVYYTAPEMYHMYDGTCRSSQYLHDGCFTMDSSWDVFSLGVLMLRMVAGPLEKLLPNSPWGEAVNKWGSVLARIVDRQFRLPGVHLSDDALEVLGCACGVGSKRDLAALYGQPKRLSAAELLELPWLK